MATTDVGRRVTVLPCGSVSRALQAESTQDCFAADYGHSTVPLIRKCSIRGIGSRAAGPCDRRFCS
jgi:hypothetical protein